MTRQHLRLLGILLIVMGLATASVVFAAPGGLENPLGCDTLAACIGRVVKWVLGLVAVVAVAFIVYGGFLYITSGGNDDQIKQGKQAVGGAIMGIIVAGLAYAIVEFVARALGAAQ